MMVHHLRQIGHLAGPMFGQIEQERIEFEWQTHHNSYDSGIFVMRHMETYMGDIRTWKSGFVAENKGQDYQIKALKKKYVTKVVMHAENTIKKEILAEVDTYHDIDASIRAQILKNTKDSRPDRFDISSVRRNQ